MSAEEEESGSSLSLDPASTLSTGFDVALLLEALAQVESARVASETVLEANIQDAAAA